jgi:hypothetical protein
LAAVRIVTANQPRVLAGCALIFAIAHYTYDKDNLLTGRYAGKIHQEFKVAEEGRILGRALNETVLGDDDVAVGVIGAGGIALAFEGRVLDLMGLNWTKMGHAHRDRTAIPGHSAFAPEVFWAESPELVLPMLHPARPKRLEIAPFLQVVLKGILTTERFQQTYTAVVLLGASVHVTAFARNDWLRERGSELRVAVLDWSAVSLN